VFRQVLEYLRSQKDVWFARHDEIAQWLIEQQIDNPSYASRFFGR
jgi:hypothetical protein